MAVPLRSKAEALTLIAQTGFTPDLIVDIGASAGTAGLYGTWPQCGYLLVEPIPRFRKALEEICRQLPGAEFKIAMAGAKSGSVEISYDPHDEESISISRDAKSGWAVARIPCLTVDELIADYERRRNTEVRNLVLKIDVDGGEVDVLAGASRALSKQTVLIVEAALLDRPASRFNSIVAAVSQHGLNAFDIIEPLFRPSDGALWQVDMVFVSPDTKIRQDFRYK